MTAAPDKAALRREALARRDALSAAERAAQSRAILDRLARSDTLPFRDALHGGVVSAFLPIRSEVDTRPILALLAERGLSLALPAVTPDGLVFRAWRPDDTLAPAGFGLREPTADAPAVRPRTLLVPLAAFDRRGERIGYGKGHYDRAIARLAADGRPLTTVGLAFSCQEVDVVPAEPHDRRLDWIMTDRELIAPSPSPLDHGRAHATSLPR